MFTLLECFQIIQGFLLVSRIFWIFAYNLKILFRKFFFAGMQVCFPGAEKHFGSEYRISEFIVVFFVNFSRGLEISLFFKDTAEIEICGESVKGISRIFLDKFGVAFFRIIQIFILVIPVSQLEQGVRGIRTARIEGYFSQKISRLRSVILNRRKRGVVRLDFTPLLHIHKKKGNGRDQDHSPNRTCDFYPFHPDEISRFNGFLVPVRDAAALAAALEKLIRDPALRQRMGQRSRARALAEFSQEQVIAETLQLYQEMPT